MKILGYKCVKVQNNYQILKGLSTKILIFAENEIRKGYNQ